MKEVIIFKKINDQYVHHETLNEKDELWMSGWSSIRQVVISLCGPIEELDYTPTILATVGHIDMHLSLDSTVYSGQCFSIYKGDTDELIQKVEVFTYDNPGHRLLGIYAECYRENDAGDLEVIVPETRDFFYSFDKALQSYLNKKDFIFEQWYTNYSEGYDWTHKMLIRMYEPFHNENGHSKVYINQGCPIEGYEFSLRSQPLFDGDE